MVTADQFTAALDGFVAREAKAVSAPPDAVAGFVDGDSIAELFQFVGGTETARPAPTMMALRFGESRKEARCSGVKCSRRAFRCASSEVWPGCTFACVFGDGRGMAVLSAEDGI